MAVCAQHVTIPFEMNSICISNIVLPLSICVTQDVSHLHMSNPVYQLPFCDQSIPIFVNLYKY
jgi:hypothetical protein